ncbi:hypothetical protein V6N13_092722 [Hibiscus sabdariffa]
MNLRRKQGFVYSNKEQGKQSKAGSGEQTMDSQDDEGRMLGQVDKGKVIGTTSSRLRPVKRTLKGKNDVCNLIVSKKSKMTSNVVGDEDEISESTSPIKIFAPMVEAGSQPRREP